MSALIWLLLVWKPDGALHFVFCCLALTTNLFLTWVCRQFSFPRSLTLRNRYNILKLHSIVTSLVKNKCNFHTFNFGMKYYLGSLVCIFLNTKRKLLFFKQKLIFKCTDSQVVQVTVAKTCREYNPCLGQAVPSVIHECLYRVGVFVHVI